MTPDELDHAPMDRGKYGPAKGNPRSHDWVSENDPTYLVWAYETWDRKPCSKVLYEDTKSEATREAYQNRVAREQTRY